VSYTTSCEPLVSINMQHLETYYP